MRKKIIIVLDEMSIGGIPIACVSFVNQLIEYCDVTMALKSVDGELVNLLSPKVNIVLTKRCVFHDVWVKILREHKYSHFFTYVIPYLYYSRIAKRWVKANEMTAREAGVIVDGEFDCSIAYHGMSISQLVEALHSVNAQKKVAWIHGDHPFSGIHKNDARKVYEKFDKIYCVSPSVCTRFIDDFPRVEKKVESYKNLLNPERIQRLSRAVVPEKFDSAYINLVTVGRISREKGQDLIPTVAAKLKKKGYNIRWYIVGDGEDRSRIQNLIIEKGVKDSVVLLGARSNPYPYMSKADIYVQPSYTEGYCLTVCEAATLAKPIVLTEIAAAQILEDGVNSIVTRSEAESLEAGIEKMILDKKRKEEYVEKLKLMDLSNKKEIEKLLLLLNE